MVAQRQPDGRVAVGFTADVIDTKQKIETFAQIAYLTPVADVQALIGQYERAHTIGPIFDPTGYQQITRTAQGHEDLARAFLSFRQAIAKISG